MGNPAGTQVFLYFWSSAVEKQSNNIWFVFSYRRTTRAS